MPRETGGPAVIDARSMRSTESALSLDVGGAAGDANPDVEGAAVVANRENAREVPDGQRPGDGRRDRVDGEHAVHRVSGGVRARVEHSPRRIEYQVVRREREGLDRAAAGDRLRACGAAETSGARSTRGTATGRTTDGYAAGAATATHAAAGAAAATRAAAVATAARGTAAGRATNGHPAGARAASARASPGRSPRRRRCHLCRRHRRPRPHRRPCRPRLRHPLHRPLHRHRPRAREKARSGDRADACNATPFSVRRSPQAACTHILLQGRTQRTAPPTFKGFGWVAAASK